MKRMYQGKTRNPFRSSNTQFQLAQGAREERVSWLRRQYIKEALRAHYDLGEAYAESSFWEQLGSLERRQT